MSATQAQKTSGTVAPGGTIATGSPTTMGNLLVVSMECAAGSGTATFTVSDNKGNVWASAGNGTVYATNAKIEQWYAPVTSAGATTLTIGATGTSLGNVQVTLEEYGPATSSPLDQAAVGTPSAPVGTISSQTTATLAQADEIVVGAAADAPGTATFTAGAGFTFNNLVSGGERLASEWQNVSSTTGIAASFGGADGNACVAIVSTYKVGATVPFLCQGNPTNRPAGRPGPFKPGNAR